ncbi:hypothetical protein [Endozoicomonas sp. 8E]|uniref:hypothetical protein n=1 Tax=Endozoicomonas sp. 8E TaxID=3035692 RepID=UPI002938F5B0|nr:hypothetical protein [Endozoicomonas sp. 8E]WOG26900.1 hypothetical protein P6910_20480 [Endozoicomonas sp. 8E]
MAYGTETNYSAPPALQDHEFTGGINDHLANQTANALVKTGGIALEQVGARAKRTFMGLSVNSIKTLTFIKDKIKSIGTSRVWKSIKQYSVRINEAWGTFARWGMGGALAGGILFGSTVGAAFSMGLGSAVGLYYATSTWSNVARQQEQADQDAVKLHRYQDLFGDIKPDEPYKLTAENFHN